MSSNLTLDPDLDSYYVQNIAVKRVPALLSQMGELQSLLIGAPSADDQVRPLLLDGMIRSSVEEIERDAAAAHRRDPDGQLKRAIAPAIGTMVADVNTYLETANTVISGQDSPDSLRPAFATATRSVDSAWSVSKSELNGLLNKRLSNLLGKLYGSLLLNGLVAGLSLLFAIMAYRQIVGPLRRTRRTSRQGSGDQGLRPAHEPRPSGRNRPACDRLQCHAGGACRGTRARDRGSGAQRRDASRARAGCPSHHHGRDGGLDCA